MDVIITGGTSFIGLAVTETLLEQGCRIWTAVRPGSPNREKLPKHENLRPLDLSLEDMERLPEAARAAGLSEKSWPVFLHMAWDGVGSAGRSDRAVQEKNIRCSLMAVEAAAALGCGRFVFSGSQAEYGICRENTAEDHPCSPVSEYGKAKLEFGRQAEALCRKLAMDYVHARIFSVYGPGDHPWSLVETCLDRFLSGGRMELGPCTQMWNYLYVEDAARALVQLLLGKAPAGVYNVAGEDTRPLRSFIEEIYGLCGRTGSYVYGDRPPNAEGVVSLQPDLTKFKEATGWNARVDFSEGIRRMIKLRRTAFGT